MDHSKSTRGGMTEVNLYLNSKFFLMKNEQGEGVKVTIFERKYFLNSPQYSHKSMQFTATTNCPSFKRKVKIFEGNMNQA